MKLDVYKLVKMFEEQESCEECPYNKTLCDDIYEATGRDLCGHLKGAL